MSPYRVCFGEEREVILCRVTEDGKGAGTNSDFTHGSNCHWAMPFANNQLRPQLSKREEVTVSLNPLRHRYRAYWTLSRTHFQSAVNSSVLGLNWCCLPWQGYCMCVYVTTLHLQITMSPHYTYISLCHHITLTDHDVTTLHLQITMSPHYTYKSLCHLITLTDHNVTTLHLQITVSRHYTYRSLCHHLHLPCHHITPTDHYATTLHLQITVLPHYTYRSLCHHITLTDHHQDIIVATDHQHDVAHWLTDHQHDVAHWLTDHQHDVVHWLTDHQHDVLYWTSDPQYVLYWLTDHQ